MFQDVKYIPVKPDNLPAEWSGHTQLSLQRTSPHILRQAALFIVSYQVISGENVGLKILLCFYTEFLLFLASLIDHDQMLYLRHQVYGLPQRSALMKLSPYSTILVGRPARAEICHSPSHTSSGNGSLPWSQWTPPFQSVIHKTAHLLPNQPQASWTTSIYWVSTVCQHWTRLFKGWVR